MRGHSINKFYEFQTITSLAKINGIGQFGLFSYERFSKKTEQYGLASQMQRAAVAIPSNIAEGHRRNHKLEYVQFLGIALGSAAELETQVLIATKEYPNESNNSMLVLLDEIQSMLYVMIRKLKD